MTDRRWSELNDTSPTDTDGVALQRGSSNFRWTFQGLRTWLTNFFAPVGHVTDTSNPHSVTAAQAGADSAGTAASEVASHDASGAAHGGVEAGFGTHTAGQSNSHAQIDSHIASSSNPHAVTATQTGAIEDILTLNGELLGYDGIQYYRVALGADGEVLTARPAAGAGLALSWEPGGVGSGTFNTVRQNSGADISSDRSRLNFIEGANVTLTISDDAVNDETDITITATPPGGGGGDMLSPASMSVGELYQSTDASGVQTAGTGFLATDVARLSQPNVFDSSASFGGNVAVQSGIFAVTPIVASARVDIWAAAGSANARYFTLVGGSTPGRLDIVPVNDAGTPIANAGVFLGHAGGVAIGNPTGGVPSTLGHVNAVELLVNNELVATDADLVAHTGDGSIHFSEASIDHTAIQNVGSNTHAQIDTHIGAANPHSDSASTTALNAHTGDATIHFTESSIVHNNISGLTTGDPHTQYHTDARGDARYIQPAVSSTIGQVGYPGTQTSLPGATIAPTFSGNRYFTATGTGAITVTTPSVNQGDLAVFLPAAIDAVSFSAAPDVVIGVDTPGQDRVLYLERFGTSVVATYKTQ